MQIFNLNNKQKIHSLDKNTFHNIILGYYHVNECIFAKWSYYYFICKQFYRSLSVFIIGCRLLHVEWPLLEKKKIVQILRKKNTLRIFGKRQANFGKLFANYWQNLRIFGVEGWHHEISALGETHPSDATAIKCKVNFKVN